MADLATELRKIRSEHGNLRRRTIVDVATPEYHPLHDRFPWDDAYAADQHRLHIAGELVRSVRVKFTDRQGEPRQIHEWHSVVRVDGVRDYLPLAEINEDPVTMQIILRDMQRDWQALRTRYGHHREFWEMVEEGLEPETE